MTDTITTDTILTMLRDALETTERALAGARCTLSSHGWVVVMHDLPLALETDSAGKVTGVHVTGWACGYSRLTRDDAENVAPTIRDGGGRAGAQALPLVVALERAHANILATLEWALEHSSERNEA